MNRKRIANLIDRHQLIGSLLYDLDLLPEQVKRGDQKREQYMVSVVQHMLVAIQWPRKAKALPKATQPR